MMKRWIGAEYKKLKNKKENGKEKGYNVHSCAEQEGLPTADSGKSCSSHWILRLVYNRLRIPDTLITK